MVLILTGTLNQNCLNTYLVVMFSTLSVALNYNLISNKSSVWFNPLTGYMTINKHFFAYIADNCLYMAIYIIIQQTCREKNEISS
jgi:hypothetical protein